LAEKKEKGLVLVFTGNGKGKTTAALGTVLRAAGHGWKIYIVFFFKGKRDSGEFTALSKLTDVVISRFGLKPFTDPKNIKPEEKDQGRKAFAAARKAVMSGDYDLVVLDEINIAVRYNLVTPDEVIELIKEKPSNVQLVLTGRYADNGVLEAADLVTEMVNIKHPFEKGIKARKGIEY
jgi:cob(I)alamin adenosyltransferase